MSGKPFGQKSTLVALCERNAPADAPHKEPLMWKAFPSHDVIMCEVCVIYYDTHHRKNPNKFE